MVEDDEPEPFEGHHCSVEACRMPVPEPPFVGDSGQLLCQAHALVQSRGLCTGCGVSLSSGHGVIWGNTWPFGGARAYASEATGKPLCIDCWVTHERPGLVYPTGPTDEQVAAMEAEARRRAEMRARRACEADPTKVYKTEYRRRYGRAISDVRTQWFTYGKIRKPSR